MSGKKQYPDHAYKTSQISYLFEQEETIRWETQSRSSKQPQSQGTSYNQENIACGTSSTQQRIATMPSPSNFGGHFSATGEQEENKRCKTRSSSRQSQGTSYIQENINCGSSSSEQKFVTMPYPTNFHGHFSVEAKCSSEVRAKWNQLTTFKGSENLPDMEKIFKEYNSGYRTYNFINLDDATKQLKQDHKEWKGKLDFKKLFPSIVELAQSLQGVFGKRLPILPLGENRTVVLKKREIACLLANSFMCTFPDRDRKYSNMLPSVNFITLFSRINFDEDKREDTKIEKLKCMFAYFYKAKEYLTSDRGDEEVRFEKHCVLEKPAWSESNKSLTTFGVMSVEDKIEDSIGIQVDFANKIIGGGVLNRGCLQEEIRFITCPELIVARLFVQQLQDDEALVIQGFEKYSHYSGYQDSFKFEHTFDDEHIKQAPLRTLVAIDATDFSEKSHGSQYTEKAIERELNKAYAGFLCPMLSTDFHIATGNWGGGSYKGDPILKARIQHLAASEVGRNIYYFPFHDYILKKKLEAEFKAYENDRTVGRAYRKLLDYARKKLAEEQQHTPHDNLHPSRISCRSRY